MRTHFNSQRTGMSWVFSTVLLCLLLCLTQATGDHSLSSLHEELTNTIQELQIHGEPDDFDANLKSLINQLEVLQVPLGKPLQLEWSVSEPSTLVGQKEVCFVVSSFEGLYINSGIGTAYYGLAELLVRNGHSVTVLYTRDTPTINGSFSEWVERYKQQGITLKYLPPATTRVANPKLQAVSLQVYRFLKDNTFDVVHFADFEGLGYYSTLAKRNGLAFDNTAFVAGLHGPTRWVLEANTGRSPAHESELEVDWMERLSVEYADYVWTPSSYLASWLSQQGWNFSSEVQLLPLPPGPELVQVAEPIARTQPKEIVFFGRLEKRKGLLLFCDALDILSKMSSLLPQNLTVTFLGTTGFVDGQNSTDYVRSRTSAWPFNVQIKSDVSRAQSIQYLSDPKSGRLPVIPSLVDNAPYTVFECLYAGIPFLASATPSIIPLLADGTAQNEHLFDTKPHNLASRLVTAFKSGVAPAASIYTIAQAEQAWIAFYNSIQSTTKAAPVSTQPLVSVIITHFNRPVLVRQALQSIEDQDYTNYEVILVDDGSNDTAALQYIESIRGYFAQKKWQIVQTGNKYLGAARNAAAKVAKGTYLVFLDDDNSATPNQLSTYVKVAEKTNANILTAAHSVFRGVLAPHSVRSERSWVPLGASLPVGLFKNCFGDANFFVEKASFLAVGGFTEEYGVGLEEHEFFAKAIFAGQKLAVIPETLLHYRLHDEQSQMLFTTNIRLGEARRIRPYLAALTETTAEVAEDEENTAATRTRRSVVELVARNALDTKEDCNATLTAVNPATGPVNGGTVITISGSGFSCGVTSVTVDGSQCTSIKIINNEQISCVTPPGTKVYQQVDIVAVVGGNEIHLPSRFSYFPLAAPELSECILANSGESITCTFNVFTNQSSGVSCAGILSSATTSKLGSGFKCVWVDTTNIDIDLGSGATIYFTDYIVVIADSVRSLGSGGLPNQETSAILKRPLSPVKPTASLSVPAAVGSCEGVKLDALSTTGYAGRAFTTISWKLVSVNPTQSAVDTINAALNAASTNLLQTITLDNTTIAVDVTYVFSVTFTNWLNQTDSTSATVKKSTAAVPKVTISGEALLKITRDQTVSLTGSATPSCGSALGSLTYLWSFSPDVSAIAATSRTSATLSVPALSLAAGTVYVATLTVTDTASGLFNSANVTINVGVRDLKALITVGSSFTTEQNIIIDASNSSDPENDPITFSWACVSADSASQTCPINLPATATIDANALTVGRWTFTLTISGTHNRTATATATITVTESALISLLVSVSPASPVSPFSTVTLTASISDGSVGGAYNWQWSLVSGTVNSDSAYKSTKTDKILIIDAEQLVPSTEYQFKVNATEPTSGAYGEKTVTFKVDKVPTANTLACVSPTGVAESTVFVYNFGKTSSQQTFGVTYTYSDLAIAIPAAAYSSNATVQTFLPTGSLSVSGRVMDLNTKAVVSKLSCASVTVSAPSSFNDIINKINNPPTDLTAFDVARLAFITRKSSASASDVSTAFGSLLNTLQSVSADTAEAVTANTASLYALTDAATRTVSNSELAALLTFFGKLITQQRNVMSTLEQATVFADLDILTNLGDQIAKTLVWPSSSSSKRSENEAQASITEADANAQLEDLSSQLNALLTDMMEPGQEKDTFSDTVDISIKKAAVSSAASTTVGPSGDVVVSPTFTNTESVPAGLIWSRYARSSFTDTKNTTFASRIFTLSSPSAVSFGAFSILIPAKKLTSSKGTCVQYDSGDQSWTSVGATTTTNSDGSISCSYTDRNSAAYAVSAAGVAATDNNNNKKDSGLSGGAIAGIAIAGAVGLAAVVGGAFGVRKYRGRGPRPATPAVVAAPVAAVPIDAAAGPAIAQPNLTGVAVEPQVMRGLATPAAATGIAMQTSPSASSSYSSSSSGSRSYAGSSSSSEEEIMEQEIKNIVGELTHALPRDSRALEVLGDKLEME